MRPFVIAAACGVLIPSMAFAQTAVDPPATLTQPSRYVQGGLMVGAAAPVAAPNLMVGLEGGWRLGTGPAWLHAAFGWGATGDDQGPGSNLQLHAGLEGRSCWWRGAVCGVGGLDAGFQSGHWSDRDDPTHNDSSNALVVVPRAGFDVGGRNLRARLGLEVDYGLMVERLRTPSTGGTRAGGTGLVGLEASAGVAYQW